MIAVSEACLIPLSVVVKARPDDGSGKRIIEVEASNEEVDSEGDVVLQKALLDSSKSFIKSGHLDIDHISEIGHRIGIKNPMSYIIGHPTEVNDLGKGITSVVGELMKSADGRLDSDNNRYDAVWKSLQSDPPVRWSASIYGFPKDMDDCTEKSCSSGATRYVIKSIDWRSLALTRNPINTSIRGYAKITTAKAMIAALQKDGLSMPFGLASPYLSETSMPPNPAPMPLCNSQCPTTMDSLWGNYQRHNDCCPFMKNGNSVMAFKDHFMSCCAAPGELADILAHALMFMIQKHRRK